MHCGVEVTESSTNNQHHISVVRRGLAHDAKVWQVSAGLLLLDGLSKGRVEQTQSRVRAQA